MLKEKFLLPTLVLCFVFISACGQKKNSSHQAEAPKEELGPVLTKKKEPHPYGGWYCPDNFGFVPVDIKFLNDVPAIANRLPTKQELDDNMSLINVDTAKYPNAKALEMDLPRVASIYSERTGMSELIIVIQAIIVQEDTVVGFRFANGGNGSAWLSDVTFLTKDEVANKGSLPFFYSRSVLKANSEDIWEAMCRTDYFKQLGEKFKKQEFFSSQWNPNSDAHLNLDLVGEKATGYVGMVFGNYYLQIDYNRAGFHYSEKVLMMENQKDSTTELYFASGPYPDNFEAKNQYWENLTQKVKSLSENK